MKSIFSIGAIAIALLILGCNDATKESGTHTHDDGSTHSDHDTTMPVQQEFKVADSTMHATDSSKEHTHDDGKKHSH